MRLNVPKEDDYFHSDGEDSGEGEENVETVSHKGVAVTESTRKNNAQVNNSESDDSQLSYRINLKRRDRTPDKRGEKRSKMTREDFKDFLKENSDLLDELIRERRSESRGRSRSVENYYADKDKSRSHHKSYERNDRRHYRRDHSDYKSDRDRRDGYSTSHTRREEYTAEGKGFKRAKLFKNIGVLNAHTIRPEDASLFNMKGKLSGNGLAELWYFIDNIIKQVDQPEPGMLLETPSSSIINDQHHHQNNPIRDDNAKSSERKCWKYR